MATLGEYTIVREIGRGTFGEVFAVYKTGSKTLCALKKIDMKMCEKKDREHVNSEVRTLSTSSHNNLVRYHDSFIEDGDMHIVMGYCKQGSLRNYILKTDKIDEQECISICIQICEGLKYLHAMNIAHRDIKTSNIFLTENMDIMIGDLGLARVIDNTKLKANLTKMVGTPYYMSPEMISGLPYNKETDIWSFGCVLYEIATKEHAFSAKTMEVLKNKIEAGTISDTEIPYCKQMNSLFRNMIQHDPYRRPSAENVLKLLLDHKSVLANATHAAYEKSDNLKPTETKSCQSDITNDDDTEHSVSCETLRTPGHYSLDTIDNMAKRRLDACQIYNRSKSADGTRRRTKTAPGMTNCDKQVFKGGKGEKKLMRSDCDTVQDSDESTHDTKETKQELEEGNTNLNLEKHGSHCTCTCDCRCVKHATSVQSCDQDQDKNSKSNNKEKKYNINETSSNDNHDGKAKHQTMSHCKKKLNKFSMSMHPTKHKQECTTWQTCLFKCSVEDAHHLLEKNEVPDYVTLHEACKVFGQTSDIFIEMCDSVCKFIAAQSEVIKHVWAAYRSGSDGVIAFVVIKETTSELSIDCKNHKVIYRFVEDYSKEASDVTYSKQSLDKIFTQEESINLNKCLQEHSESLMKEHTNITVISACSVTSKGYGMRTAKISPDTCIVIYVHVKGLIPIQEKTFPKLLNEFPVDVRESDFRFFGARAKEYQETLKMGCAIFGKHENGDCFQGTLGAFIDDENSGDTYCITSAHVLLNDIEMAQLQREGGKKMYDRCVFQNDPYDKNTKFGSRVEAFYKTGGIGSTGVEFAIVKIVNRQPVSGCFPDGIIERFERAGFRYPSQMQFNSGKIENPNETSCRSDVIKFGCETEVSRGTFYLHGPAVKKSVQYGNHMTFNYELHNQLEILSTGTNDPFAVNGDSGALVLLPKGGNPFDLRAVGLLEGMTRHGTYIVTPIWSILEELIPAGEKKLKSFQHVERTTLSPLAMRSNSGDSAISMSPIYSSIPKYPDQMKERLDKQDIKINRLEEKVDQITKQNDRHHAEQKADIQALMQSIQQMMLKK